MPRVQSKNLSRSPVATPASAKTLLSSPVATTMRSPLIHRVSSPGCKETTVKKLREELKRNGVKLSGSPRKAELCKLLQEQRSRHNTDAPQKLLQEQRSRHNTDASQKLYLELSLMYERMTHIASEVKYIRGGSGLAIGIAGDIDKLRKWTVDKTNIIGFKP